MKSGERITILNKGFDRIGRLYEKDAFDGKHIVYGVLGVENVKGSSIDVANISHTFSDIEISEDGTVTAVLTVLKTPAGKILEELINSGARLNTYICGIGDYDDFTRKVSKYNLTTVAIEHEDGS